MISALSSRVNSSAFLNARVNQGSLKLQLAYSSSCNPQARARRESGVKIGEFAKHFDHTPVVFQRVQTRPRQDVAPAFRVAVLRLMHVPQHGQMNPLHCVRLLPVLVP